MPGIKVELYTPKSDGTEDTWEIDVPVAFDMKREVSFNVDIGLPAKDAEDRYLMPFLGQSAVVSVNSKFQYDKTMLTTVLDKAKYHASADLTKTQYLRLKDADSGELIVEYGGRVQSITVSMREPTVIDLSIVFKLGKSGA